jgi:predicted nucleic acid-binding protein
MPFIDTNIFLRYLTKDDPDKAQACFELFKRAESNQIVLTATETVIAEVVYVLSSKRTYNLPRDQIRARLYSLLTLQGLRLPQRRMVLRALDLYVAYEIGLFEKEGNTCYTDSERQSSPLLTGSQSILGGKL